MKLINLKLTNFKGVRSFEFKPNGKSVQVFGANETGKTTLADALTYLLFDKDTAGRTPEGFGIKTRENGEVLNGIEHIVEGQFDSVTLRKEYKEVWTQKRGNSTKTFSGHTTDHYVDDIPVKASEYKEAIEDIMPEDLFRILTVPNYFAEQMHWTERRKVLFEFAGDIDDQDIIDAADGLESYIGILDGKTHDQRNDALKASRKKLNEQLDNIPSRIDENTRMLADVEGVDQARERIEALKKEKSVLDEQRSDINVDGGISDLRVKIQDIEADKSRARNAHKEKLEGELTSAREKVADLQDKVDSSDAELRNAQREYTTVKSQVEQLQEELDHIAGDVESEENRQPNPKPDKKEPKPCPMGCPPECPECGANLITGEGDSNNESQYETYLADFNEAKAQNIKDLREKFDAVQSQLNELSRSLEEKKKSGAQIQSKHEQRKTALQKAQSELEEKKRIQPEFDGSDFNESQKQIQDRIDDIQSEKQNRLGEIDEKIRDVESQIETENKLISADEQNRKIRQRIAELEAERKKAATELESVDEQLFIMEEFVRARSAYVTERVNEKFRFVTWRLFKEQVNGGLDECCDPMVNGVPYSEGLNNAGRIQAGIEIIDVLSGHYGKSAPVMVDNRESVTKLPETDQQVISLIVSPEHKSLTIEDEPQLQVA